MSPLSARRTARRGRATWLRVGVVAVTALVMILPVACQFVAGLERPDTSTRTPEEASVDAGVDAPDAPDALPLECRPLIERPHVPPSTAEIPAFFLAFSYMTYLPSPSEGLCPTAGLALDDKHTGLDDAGNRYDCPADASDASCASSCLNPSVDGLGTLRDFAGGVDNSFLRIRNLLASGPDLVNSATAFDLTPTLRTGKGNLLLKITNYNGEANDDDVGVGLFESLGVTQPLDGDWDGITALTWNGTSTGVTASGFVNQGVFAVDIPSHFVMPFFGAMTFDAGLDGKPVRVNVESARITGKLVRLESGRYAISSGLMGTRLRTSELIRVVSNVPATVLDSHSDGGLACQHASDLDYRAKICLFADLASVPGGLCDRFSAGVAFRAGPAEINLVEAPLPPMDPCYAALDGAYNAFLDCDYIDAGH